MLSYKDSKIDELFERIGLYDIALDINEKRSGHKDFAIYLKSKSFLEYLSIKVSAKTVYVMQSEAEAYSTYFRLKKEIKDGVYIFPYLEDKYGIKDNTYTQKRIKERVSSLSAIANDEQYLVITYPEAICQRVPKIEKYIGSSISLCKGDKLEIRDLAKAVSDIGYKRVDQIIAAGEYQINGDVISIFPFNMEDPVRISFFDDEIEDIREYILDDGTSIKSSSSLRILAAYFDKLEHMERVLSVVDREVANRVDSFNEYSHKELLITIYNEIKREYEINGNIKSNRALWLYPFLSKCNDSIFDFAKDALFIYESKNFIFSLLENILFKNQDEFIRLYSQGLVLDVHQYQLLSVQDLYNRSLRVDSIDVVLAKSEFEYYKDRTYELDFVDAPEYSKAYFKFKTDVSTFYNQNFTTLLFTENKSVANGYVDSLYKEGIFSKYIVDENVLKDFINIVAHIYQKGFISYKHKIAVLGIYDLSGREASVKREDRRYKKVFTSPNIGDYVVHDNYGIGLCRGIANLEVDGVKKDFIKIEYANNSFIYIPLDDLGRLQRYAGSNDIPKLSSLVKRDFDKTKSKVRKAVREMAVNLLEVYAKRRDLEGFKYPSDNTWQEKMEEAFPYPLTVDQKRETECIKEEMESGKLMDRLLCGDVGFGKTEVAIRVAFKTIQSKKQVAFLAPTTILAKQHYQTCQSRLYGFDVNIALLTRFTKKDELEEYFAKIKSGEIDLIIGTHKILSSKLAFKDLGLLILDEEQRFGVEQKEKIKSMKSKINVLSMSATPIPRTLNMSLSGLRDISILKTPPQNRLAIETFVLEKDDKIIKEAITNELSRGGQVFVLNNRIEELDEIEHYLKIIVPSAKIVQCHSRMSNTVLDNNISSFFDRKADVLLSTTIIENGIDIPCANTLIIMDATRYGLSQLYQIRGRVGRSGQQAYAYLFYDKGEALSYEAKQRLAAIQNYSELGAGFNIAMRDLEIRGAGNVLGREQSGHMMVVGYDLYTKMIDDEIKKLKGQELREVEIVNMDVTLDSYIPEKYISSENERLKIYKEIADIWDIDDYNLLLSSIEERYGKVPIEIVNSMLVVLAKAISYDSGIKSIFLDEKEIKISLSQSIMTLVNHLQDQIIASNGEFILDDAYKNFSIIGRFKNKALSDILWVYINAIDTYNKKYNVK